jgi:hypothetical protein
VGFFDYRNLGLVGCNIVLMKRFLSLLMLTGLLFGQDVLILKSGESFEGTFYGKLGKDLVFQSVGDTETKKYPIWDVASIKTGNNEYFHPFDILTKDEEITKKLKTAQSKGIAISFNPNFSNLLAGSPSLVDPTFYYVFKKGNISLEPAIGFMGVNEENDYSKRKSSIMTIGLGLLMHKSDTTGLSPYYGLRFTRITVSQEVNYDDDYFMESDSDSESALSIAPVYGLEYYVNKHFSISGELQLNYFKPEEDEDGGSFTQTEIMSKLFFRFYF